MPTMTIFEPLFILLVLVTAVTLITAAAVAARGQGGRALRSLRRLAYGAGAYFAVVIGVALATPQRVYHIGEPQCFDDWCIAVTGATHKAAGTSVTWTVMLRVSSRARGITQSEKGAAIYLTDSRHRRFDPVPCATTGALYARVGPGESAEATPRSTPRPAPAGRVGTCPPVRRSA